MKISDSLIAPLSREEHIMADVKREDYFLIYLPQAINLLQEYIDSLQQELENERDNTERE